MRIALAAFVIAAAGAFAVSTPAEADPYRWCADYGAGDMGGGTNCYFMTIEQCRAAIFGMGGFCRENGFYDGRPVSTSGEAPAPHRKKKHTSG